MKQFILFFISMSWLTMVSAKQNDTVMVSSVDLNLSHLPKGEFRYLQFTKKLQDSPSQKVSVIKFNVTLSTREGKPAFLVTQEWDADTTIHKCTTFFDSKTFVTLMHETYWKRLGYTMKFDFQQKRVNFKNANISDSTAQKNATKDFYASFNSYNLNWHADMIIYSLLPYKEGRTFAISYYDPGFGPAEKILYTVICSDELKNNNGAKVSCWVLNSFNDAQHPESGYERYWINKKTYEVLKMESYDGLRKSYRYKVKIGLSVL